MQAAITRPWNNGTTISSGSVRNPYFKPLVNLSKNEESFFLILPFEP